LATEKCIGYVIHSDVCGPFTDSLAGTRSFVSFIDELSRLDTMTSMKRKKDTKAELKKISL
jgi:hypothetical protein